MSRDTAYAFAVVFFTLVALGFAGRCDYEAQMVIDESPVVYVADGAR